MNLIEQSNQTDKKRKFMYILILFICAISIIIAFYIQFYTRINITNLLGIDEDTSFAKKSEEQIGILKSEFDQIFTNNISNNENSQEDKKKDKDKSLVYTEYEKKDTQSNNYDINVHIPYINIESEVIDTYNKEIKNIFENKINNILESKNKNIIYAVKYVADIQDDILSVIIRSNLKEGSSPQRVIIQTYNYDLRNNKEITLSEYLKIKQMDNETAENKIRSEIKAEEKNVQDLKELGYNIYNRDVTSEIYKIENSKEFYIADNTLYIIYAYGNDSFTSEMDLIIF